MRLPIILYFAFSVLSLSSLANVPERDGVKMLDRLTVGSRTLVLNGMGTRKATFLKLKIYVAGLYLETPSRNAEEILTSKTVKKINLVFLRDVSAKKLASVWTESFEKNCKPKCKELTPILNQLNAQFTDVKEGDLISFTFLPDGLEIVTKNRSPEKISNVDFAKTILTIWLGQDPPNPELKEGLLGKAES